MHDSEVDEIVNPLPSCYFSGDKHGASHPNGHCMSCDWHRGMSGLEWSDSEFIEYWDYAPYWNRKVRAEGVAPVQEW